MLKYPVTLSHDSNGALLVDFPDVPHAHSVGVDQQEALSNAIDALETAFEMCIDEGRKIPLPTPLPDRVASVRVPAETSAKVLLWNEMLDQDLAPAQFASRLGVALPEALGLFDLSRPTNIDLIEKAAQVLGKRIDLRLIEDFADAAPIKTV
jgi:antitoxin HicB